MIISYLVLTIILFLVSWINYSMIEGGPFKTILGWLNNLFGLAAIILGIMVLIA